MNKFTEKQIQDACTALHFEDADLLIEKLDQPDWKPNVGQVIYNKKTEDYFDFVKYGIVTRVLRPLSLTEHGPDVRALQEALEKIVEGTGFGASISIAADILKNHRIPE